MGLVSQNRAETVSHCSDLWNTLTGRKNTLVVYKTKNAVRKINPNWGNVIDSKITYLIVFNVCGIFDGKFGHCNNFTLYIFCTNMMNVSSMQFQRFEVSLHNSLVLYAESWAELTEFSSARWSSLMILGLLKQVGNLEWL